MESKWERESVSVDREYIWWGGWWEGGIRNVSGREVEEWERTGERECVCRREWEWEREKECETHSMSER